MIYRKRPLTVLEVLIAVALVALIGSVIMFNVRKFYLQQQTLTEMSQVAHLFYTVEELMMMGNLDTKVVITQKNNQLQLVTVPLSSIPHMLKTFIPRPPLILKHIDTLTFEDQKPALELSFKSKGFEMPRGILQMKGEGITRSLLFYGYPAPVHLENARLILPKEPLDFMEQITAQTAQETARK